MLPFFSWVYIMLHILEIVYNLISILAHDAVCYWEGVNLVLLYSLAEICPASMVGVLCLLGCFTMIIWFCLFFSEEAFGLFVLPHCAHTSCTNDI